jgi:hypothetical protein
MNYKKALKKINRYAFDPKKSVKVQNKIRNMISLLSTSDVARLRGSADTPEFKENFRVFANTVAKICDDSLVKRQNDESLVELSEICSDYIDGKDVSELWKRAHEVFLSVPDSLDCIYIYRLAKGISLMLNNEMHKDDFSDVELESPEQKPEQAPDEEGKDCSGLPDDYVIVAVADICKKFSQGIFDYDKLQESIKNIIAIDNKKYENSSFIADTIKNLTDDVLMNEAEKENELSDKETIVNDCNNFLTQIIQLLDRRHYGTATDTDTEKQMKELNDQICSKLNYKNDCKYDINYTYLFNVSCSINRLLHEVISPKTMRANNDF